MRQKTIVDPCESREQQTSCRLRVATWNVFFGEMATPQEIGAALAPLRLDAIGFCEVPGGNWTAEVGRVLGMEHWCLSQSSSANHKDKYKSILSRTSLTAPREIEPAGTGWWPCTLMGATTVVRGVEIALYSLHVPGSAHGEPHAHGLQAADSQAGYIAREIVPRETARELLMMGDYNDRVDDPNLDYLEAAGMRATWRDLDIDLSDQFTFSSRGEGIQHSGVIDHILYRPGTGTRAVNGGIVELDPPLSDHKPVWTELVIPATT